MLFDKKKKKKMHFFTQISERSTCMHWHHSDLDSGGQRYLEMTKRSLHMPKPRVGGILLHYYRPTCSELPFMDHGPCQNL